MRVNDFPLRKIGPSESKEHFLSLNQNLKRYLSKMSLAEGTEVTHVWLLRYCTSSADGRCFFITEGRFKLRGLFHNKETSFVVFCSKLVFLNTDPLLMNTIPFKVCKSVHHRTIQTNHQPDANFFQFITLTFIYSSTCFGRFPAHHQELDDCSGSTTVTTIRR